MSPTEIYTVGRIDTIFVDWCSFIFGNLVGPKINPNFRRYLFDFISSISKKNFVLNLQLSTVIICYINSFRINNWLLILKYFLLVLKKIPSQIYSLDQKILIFNWKFGQIPRQIYFLDPNILIFELKI